MIDDDEFGAVGGIRIDRGNRSSWRKPALVSLCPSQISHDLTWARTRAASVGSRRLAAWAWHGYRHSKSCSPCFDRPRHIKWVLQILTHSLLRNFLCPPVTPSDFRPDSLLNIFVWNIPSMLVIFRMCMCVFMILRRGNGLLEEDCRNRRTPREEGAVHSREKSAVLWADIRKPENVMTVGPERENMSDRHRHISL
jgi:hypothetical protein